MSHRSDSIRYSHDPSSGTSTGGRTNRATLGRSESPASTLDVDDDNDDGDDQIIMAVDQCGPKMGCAYYTAADQTLSFLEDVELPSADCFDARELLERYGGGGVAVVANNDYEVKFQVNPTVLLLSSRMDDIESASLPTGEDCSEGELEKPYRILVRAAGEFAYESARSKLVALRIGQEYGPDIIIPTDLHDVSGRGQSRGKLLKLASWIELNSRISVGCAGAVLAYLQRRKVNAEGGVQGEGLQVQSIEMFSLADVMLGSMGSL